MDGHKKELSHRVRFLSTDALATQLKAYIHWYNTVEISTKVEGVSPVQYRALALAAWVLLNPSNFPGPGHFGYMDSRSSTAPTAAWCCRGRTTSRRIWWRCYSPLAHRKVDGGARPGADRGLNGKGARVSCRWIEAVNEGPAI